MLPNTLMGGFSSGKVHNQSSQMWDLGRSPPHLGRRDRRYATAMQRAQFWTDWRGLLDGTRSRDFAGVGVVALLCLLIVGSAMALLASPQEAVWDQGHLLKASFEAPFYPSPPMGFTAQLCVIAVKALRHLLRGGGNRLWPQLR